MMGFIYFICGLLLIVFLVLLGFIHWGWSIIRALQGIDKPEDKTK